MYKAYGQDYQCFVLPPTRQFLVLPREGILLLTGLVQLVSDALDLGDLGAQVTLRCLIQDDSFIQSGLYVNVDLLQMLNTLLQFTGSVVCLSSFSMCLIDFGHTCNV